MKRSEENIMTDRKKATVRMKKCRERETDCELDLRRQEDIDRKTEMREKRTEEEIKSDREKAKVGMIKLREREEYEEYKEYEKLKDKHRHRKFRKNMSSEDHQYQREKANQGMKEFRERGRLRKYAERSNQNTEEFDDWRKYKRKNEKNSRILERFKPDLVEQINEKNRIDREERREREFLERYTELQRFEFRGTEKQKIEFSALKQELHESVTKKRKKEDIETALAVQDETKVKKLEYYYEREAILNEEERQEFNDLRAALYKEFRKMNNIKENPNPANLPPNWDMFKKMKEKDEIKEKNETKKQEEASIMTVLRKENTTKKKVLKITYC